MKTFNGKAIYNPSGKAGEYSYWACNFYVGCSNGCTYCYCKKGILAGVMGQDKAQLKKCFKDEKHALEVFEKELLMNKTELQKHGIFFSFTTDPMLAETIYLTMMATCKALKHNIPVSILTKNACFLNYSMFNAADFFNAPDDIKNLISFGFTLTGHDELEPNVSTNEERAKALEILHKQGFKTFLSIEPIITIDKSWEMIYKYGWSADMLKIGLESGKKYPKEALYYLIGGVNKLFDEKPIYWKDSILSMAGIERKDLPENCVNRDFRLHEARIHVA
jgi:DNA repair photolyase